ncbi:MAG: hypothetical protein MZU95_16565 [Desulfomicrobium escambiense]|nr:hypothetical protein [Desulfomicrobium escambiense]
MEGELRAAGRRPGGRRIMAAHDEMAAKGMRVLGVGLRTWDRAAGRDHGAIRWSAT